MKVYLLTTCWYEDTYLRPTETKAFIDKKIMIKKYAELINSQSDLIYLKTFPSSENPSYFECKTVGNCIKVYNVDKQTNKKEYWPYWDKYFEEVEVEGIE